MSKFKKKKSGDLPPVSTASLPDIVFMLLFFFMTVTVMKDSDLMVASKYPTASEVQELDKKDPVIYIYAGKPQERFIEVFGESARIQLNDKFADIADIGPYILEERASFPEEKQNRIIIALKVDGETNMGLVSDVKQELRKVNALKINYITKEGDPLSLQ